MKIQFITIAVLLLLGTVVSADVSHGKPKVWARDYPLTLGVGRSEAVPQPDLVRTESVAKNPLRAPVTMVFGGDVMRVGDAARAVAGDQGYEFIDSGGGVSAMTQRLSGARLPDSHRRWVQVTTEDILIGLAGVGHVVVVDHVSRRITFDPRPLYKEATGSRSTVFVPITQSPSTVTVPITQSPSTVSDSLDGERVWLTDEDEENTSSVSARTVTGRTISTEDVWIIRHPAGQDYLSWSTDEAIRSVGESIKIAPDDMIIVVAECSGSRVSRSQIRDAESLLIGAMSELGAPYKLPYNKEGCKYPAVNGQVIFQITIQDDRETQV